MSADFDDAERALIAQLGLSGDFAAMRAEERIAAAEAKAAEAWEAGSPRKGVELAQEALAISFYCAPAWTMLSITETSAP